MSFSFSFSTLSLFFSFLYCTPFLSLPLYVHDWVLGQHTHCVQIFTTSWLSFTRWHGMYLVRDQPSRKLMAVQFSSVAQLCPTLCEPMDCSMPGLPVHHQLLEPAQTHVHWVGDAIQPSHLLSSPPPPTFNLSQHQGLFQWVSSLHRVAKGLEFQLQHQSFQWIFRTDFP